MILLKNVVKNSNLVPRLTFNFSNQNSSRQIFSAKFHDIDLLKDREAKQKLLISDIDFFKKNIKDNYEKHDIKNIFDGFYFPRFFGSKIMGYIYLLLLVSLIVKNKKLIFNTKGNYLFLFILIVFSYFIQ